MLKTVIILPDGTELSSGQGSTNAIQSTSFMESVNSGEELTIGSTCASSVEVKIFTPNGDFSLASGEEIELYREDDAGRRWKLGVFICEKPTRQSANTFKFTAYDRVIKLDKSLAAWLSGLDGWPYDLNTFATMVCEQCGLNFIPDPTVPNADFKVREFYKSDATGRMLMRWLGEICCSFCRADADGNIKFDWYTPAETEITATGDTWYFAKGLTYEDFVTEKIGCVRARLADADGGALWPPDDIKDNPYAIAGNQILVTDISLLMQDPETQNDPEVLTNIFTRLENLQYTPCKIDLQASMNIRAGHIVKVTDINGKTFTMYVMSKKQTGQKDTLECTGSLRRDSATATNNRTQQEALSEAVSAITREDIFNKLTNNGKVQGIYQRDDKWYVNADVMQSGLLKSKDGRTYFDLDSGEIVTETETGKVIVSSGKISLCDLQGDERIRIASEVQERSDGSEYVVLSMKFFAANGKMKFGLYSSDNEPGAVRLVAPYYTNPNTDAFTGGQPVWGKAHVITGYDALNQPVYEWVNILSWVPIE